MFLVDARKITSTQILLALWAGLSYHRLEAARVKPSLMKMPQACRIGNMREFSRQRSGAGICLTRRWSVKQVRQPPVQTFGAGVLFVVLSASQFYFC